MLSRSEAQGMEMCHFLSTAGQLDQTYMVSSLGGRLSKKKFTLSGPLQRAARNDSKVGCQIFWVIPVTNLLIAPILKKVGI